MEPMRHRQKLRVATTDHIHYIDIKDIVRIQSLSNYSQIFFASGKSILVSKVLAHFDTLLADFDFMRVHRTHLVNLHCVTAYEHGNLPTISLYNNEILPVARSKKKMLKQEMNMLSVKSVRA